MNTTESNPFANTLAPAVPPAAAGAMPFQGASPDALETALPALPLRLRQLLDAAATEIETGAFVAAFRRLCGPLSALWTEARSTHRDDELLAIARAHRLYGLAQQDPFTERAANKPRGYAGDAVMMDYIYKGSAPADTTATGAGIFAATTRCATGLSVRYRRALLRSVIDETASQVHGARILSVASGHCRELDGSLIQHNWFDGEVVALDQDPLSCAEVQRAQAQHRVRVVERGVRALVGRDSASQDLGQFDLIYSAGLYDYLPDAMAQRLTALLASLLRPGGRLLLANFLPACSGRGYMEMIMDWHLIMRNKAEMLALCEGTSAPVADCFHDPHHNVVYVDMRAPGAA